MNAKKPKVLACSSCGQEFIIPGRNHGFSHCDNHSRYTPIGK